MTFLRSEEENLDNTSKRYHFRHLLDMRMIWEGDEKGTSQNERNSRDKITNLLIVE